MKITRRIALANVLVALVVLAIKTVAYVMTDSIALLSDALESIVNVAASIAALIAIALAAKPADRNHPFGHHKAEYLSAVVEGALILVAAIVIFREAWIGIVASKPLDAPFEGVAVNAFAALINGAWCVVLLRVGRRHRSPALVADGRHLLTDVVSSLGVLVGVSLAIVTGWPILDPLLALIVALNILWSGWQLIKGSVAGLMDAAPPDAEVDQIRGIIAANADGAIEAHDLRTRTAGPATFIEFHLVVPGTMSVDNAHEICDRIEAALRTEVEQPVITIHVEPENKAKHEGIVVL
ncbi:MAG: cation transporter [Rhizobiales bacterium]|nr:cation transporter [Hyphomicrobiales bacterium]